MEHDCSFFMQNARSAALCLTSLFLIASMMPFAAALATLE